MRQTDRQTDGRTDRQTEQSLADRKIIETNIMKLATLVALVLFSITKPGLH